MPPNLYLATIPETVTGTELHHMYGMVSPDRATRAKRFLKAADTHRSLTGELLLRKILKERHDIETPEIVTGSCGKPRLSTGDICFNLSHAGRYVLLATGISPVGVDIESPRKVSPGLAKMVFTESERGWIGQAADAKQAFFQLWTLKEAYIKATGRGLQKPLQEICFTIDAGGIRLKDSADSSASARFFFTQGTFQDAWWALCGEDPHEIVAPQEIAFEELLLL